MKYCSNCGGQVEDDDIFCGYCGTKLKQDATQEESSAKQDDGKQDFGEVSSQKDETYNDFGASFDKEFGEKDEFAKSDEEFESYVEHGSSPNVFVTNNYTSNERQPLKENKLAKEANTFGILALVFGILGGILGIVFGIIGLVKAKKAMELCNTGEYDGKPKASNGKILSIVGIVLSVLEIIYYIL